MTKIIGFVKQKGGVGSSTLCLSVYFALKTFGNDLAVCLVDLDEQGSLITQKKRNEDIEVFENFDIETLQNFDIAIVDGPPRLTKSFAPVYQKADVLIIPTKTGLYDAAATVQTFEYLQEQGHGDKSYIVLNMATPNAGINVQFLDTLKKNEIPYLKAVIFNRLAFHQMQYKNGNIFDLKRQKKAQEEIKNLAIEIYSLLIK